MSKEMREQLPPLATLVQRAETNWMKSGVSTKERKRRLGKLVDQFILYQNAWDLVDKGSSWYGAGLRLQIPHITAYSWLAQGRVPDSIRGILKGGKPVKNITIKPGENPSFAGFLGGFLGQIQGTTEYKRTFSMLFQEEDHPEAIALRALLDDAFEERAFTEVHPESRDNDANVKDYQLLVQGQQLFDEVKDITLNYTSVGWEYLSSFETRRMFAKWFLRCIYENRQPNAGTKTLEQLKVTKKLKYPDLMEQVAVVFYDLGTTPHIKKTGPQKGLVFNDPDDIRRLQALDCIPAGMEARAQVILDNKKGKHYLLKAYQEVELLRKKKHSEKESMQSRKRIEKKYGIQDQRIRAWFRGAKKPEIVKRYETLSALANERKRRVLEETVEAAGDYAAPVVGEEDKAGVPSHNKPNGRQITLSAQVVLTEPELDHELEEERVVIQESGIETLVDVLGDKETVHEEEPATRQAVYNEQVELIGVPRRESSLVSVRDVHAKIGNSRVISHAQEDISMRTFEELKVEAAKTDVSVYAKEDVGLDEKEAQKIRVSYKTIDLMLAHFSLILAKIPKQEYALWLRKDKATFYADLDKYPDTPPKSNKSNPLGIEANGKTYRVTHQAYHNYCKLFDVDPTDMTAGERRQSLEHISRNLRGHNPGKEKHQSLELKIFFTDQKPYTWIKKFDMCLTSQN